MFAVRISVFVLLSLVAVGVHAQGFDNPFIQGSRLLTISHDHGLISDVPAPVTQELTAKVRWLRDSLLAQKAKIIKVIENSQFDTKDKFISILMPGGLLYASHKKLTHDKAEKELVQVDNQLDDLAIDLQMLESISGRMTLAMVH